MESKGRFWSERPWVQIALPFLKSQTLQNPNTTSRRMAEVETVFVSAGCNRSAKAAAWGPCDLIAFGAHNLVAIFCPKRAAILATLPGHKDHVNCVEWLPRDAHDLSDESFLLSGSADGSVILWALTPSERKWRAASQIPSPHERSVTCIASIMLSSSEALFASSASDGTVRVWNTALAKTGECTISLVQSISMGSKAMVAVTITRLPSEEIIIAMGGLDNQIHLYVGSKMGQFISACKLKGHQDWIRGLDFSKPVLENGAESLFLASSSQDRNIRIWKISSLMPGVTSNGPSLKGFIEGPVLRAGNNTWQVSLESLLVGHEDWVYSVCWQPPSTEGNCSQPMSVLSSSMDKTMMIWRPDTKSGIWMNEVSVGELGHSAFGFYGGLWSPSGDAILAHGFNGSFHLWRNLDTGWLPQLVPSGHFGPVVGVAWAKTGQFLLSASHDQTTRVFACWNNDKEHSTNLRKSGHEIARPQVHGHDMNCLAVVQGKGNHRYVSGAEEKVARVFEAPTAFLDTVAYGASESKHEVEREGVQILGANMSALGLSQKPVYTHGNVNDDGAFDGMESLPNAVPTVLTEPPLEEQLIQNTLWPESHKLYGHGNELFSMCSNYSGEILATACKAQSSNVAEIWLWETSSWRPIAQLHSHSLTVTQMQFSHDDRYLLSVSRDRHLSVFRNSDGEQPSSSYSLLVKIEAHKRIIWTCSWSLCDRYFATGSRDKTVKIWSMIQANRGEVAVKLHTTLPVFKSSVTALAWSRLLAVGLESGLIELWNTSATEFSCLTKLDPQACHVASVNQLSWNELDKEGVDDNLKLASCGADHTVRLFNVRLLG